ncbi:MAG TPA: hypothetical protein VG892_10040, partial [Terriglobales bacterium]|nr:hypothetical protein [Terriglobales bacterium]
SELGFEQDQGELDFTITVSRLQPLCWTPVFSISKIDDGHWKPKRRTAATGTPQSEERDSRTPFGHRPRKPA